jgi:hypothetical protein
VNHTLGRKDDQILNDARSDQKSLLHHRAEKPSSATERRKHCIGPLNVEEEAVCSRTLIVSNGMPSYVHPNAPVAPQMASMAGCGSGISRHVNVTTVS